MGRAELTTQDTQVLDAQLASDIREYTEASRQRILTPTEMIFGDLLMRAVKTRTAGNYGIASVYSFTLKGFRLKIYGHNGLATRGVPGAHAERDALQRVAKLVHITDDNRRQEYFDSLIRVGLATFEPSLDEDPGTLYTSLECCGGCKTDVITAKVPRVVCAVTDPGAGEMHEGRFERYTGEVFRWLADSYGLERILCQREDAMASHYIAPELAGLLERVFYETKQPLDQHLLDHPMLEPSSLRSLTIYRT